jgi:prepilin-type N-terminal cleavage/methylation domain-containing protein/prepilin-type processing-associated H-X9-DG protein
MRGLFSSASRRSAFTLVELLCVIAIIGILAGLLMPSLGTMQQKADSITCASNLRGIGNSVQLYLQDHSFIYPEIETDPVSMAIYPSGYGTPQSMLQAFGPYGVTAKVLQCPADMKSPNCSYNAILAASGTTYATSYDWKPTLDDENQSQPLYYTRFGGRMGVGVTGTIGGVTVISPKLSKVRQVFDDNSPPGIHFGHVNALYADGHVVAYTGPVTH